jgi:hypothetical protein
VLGNDIQVIFPAAFASDAGVGVRHTPITSPLGGEVGARSAPGEGVLLNRAFCPLTPCPRLFDG